MNKRILAVVVLGVCMTSSAFANRARLSVMGTGDGGAFLGFGVNGAFTNGSLYYDDAYNMFYNPAAINDYGSMVVMEKGANAVAITSPVAQSASAIAPFGGFTMGMSSVKIGFFFNRPDSLTTGASFSNPTVRPFDLIVGTDVGAAKVGLGLTYSSSQTAGPANTAGQDDSFTNRSLKANIGVNVANAEIFAGYQFLGDERTTLSTANTDYGKAQAYNIGFKYHFGEWTPYAGWRTATSQPLTAAGGVNTVQLNAWGLGLGRSMAVAEGVRVNYAISYWNGVFAVAGNRSQRLPIDLSAEGDVLSWLTLRGGMSYRLMDMTIGGGNNFSASNSFQTNADATTVRFGAGLHIGKVDLDWAIGGLQNFGQASADATNFGFDGGLFTNATLTYRI